MKCIINGSDTKSFTSNYPTSISGRKLLPQITEAYNKLLMDEFIQGAIDATKKAGQPVLDEESFKKNLGKMAPKITKKGVLEAIATEHETAMKIVKTILEGE